MATLKKIGCFTQTKEMAFVTLNGWDGKSYNGEGRNLRVWVDDKGNKFVKLMYKGSSYFHIITNEIHPKSGVVIAEFFTYFD